MIPGHWLLAAALALVASELLLVVVLVARNSLVQWSLLRRARRSRVLSAICNSLGAQDSAHLRAELARRDMLADLQSLEAWLDLVVARGDDPALLRPEEYERGGLVSRYIARLREARAWSARAAAAEVLGWTRSPRAVEPLLATALDTRGEDPAVRAVALRALGRIRHPLAVTPLIEALGSAETWFPPRAAEMLVRIGEPAVEPLTRLLLDQAAPIVPRRWAAQILGEVRDRRALLGLHGALSDVDAELRAKAARALGNLAQERSVQPLLDRLLSDPIPFVRTCVARALGQLSTERTVEFLVEALSDPEWWVRLRAVEGLAQLGEPARQVLQGALHDNDPQVAHEAARALEGLGVVAEMLERLRHEGYSPAVTELLVDVGRAGNLEALLDALESPDVELVTSVVRIVGRVGNPTADHALIQLLRAREEPAVQARVIDALRRVGAAGHVGEVLPFVASSQEWVRKTAVDYLERFADAQVLPLVAPLLQDSNPWGREAALRLMERLRPPEGVAWQIEAALSDPYAFVRAQAVRTVCGMGRFDLLTRDGLELVEDDAPVREALLDGLSRSDDPLVLELALALMPGADIEALDRLAPVVRAAAEADARRAARLLTTADDVARRWAMALLGARLDDPTLRARARGLASDPDERVRAAAVSALAQSAQAPEGVTSTAAASTVALLQAMDDPSALVVRGAIRALATHPCAAAAQPLRRALSHADAAVCVEAAFAVALRRERSSMRALLAAGSDRRPSVRLAALMGLVFLGERTALTSWLAELRRSESAAQLACWRKSQHPLLARLTGGPLDARATLEQRLLGVESAPEAEEALLRELDSNPDADVRCQAAQGLATLESRRAVSLMLATSQRDPAPEVRIAALRFLVRENAFGHRRRYLESGLRDAVEAVQVAAAHLSILLEDSEAIPLLVGHLETRRPGLRDALTDMLAGRAENGVEPVLDAVMGRPTTADLMLGLIAVLRKVAAPLSEEVLGVLLRHRWAQVRAAALSALARRPGGVRAEHVVEAAQDPAEKVRERALGLFTAPELNFTACDPARRRAVLTGLDDPSGRVRARAALLAGRLWVRDAQPRLQALAGDRDRRCARAAAAATRALLREVPATS